MGFLESILTWILGWILKYLADKTTAAVIDKLQDVERDKQREQVNEANVKAYDEAVARADRIRAATDLLNRVRK